MRHLLIPIVIAMQSPDTASAKPMTAKEFESTLKWLHTSIASIEMVAPDIGVTYDGRVSIATEPVLQLSSRWSLGFGLSYEFPAPQQLNFSQQLKYLVGDIERGGLDFGAGTFVNLDGEWGPTASFEIKTTFRKILRIGGGTQARYNLSQKRIEGRVYIKLEIPFLIWRGY